MVVAEHEAATLHRHVQLVERLLQADDVVHAELHATGLLVGLTRCAEHRGGGGVLVRGEGVRRLRELGHVDGSRMGILHTADLVVGDGVKLIVGDRGRLGLELVELDGDVAICQFLHRQWIGRVVDEHVRVASHIDQVDHVVVHDAGVVGDAIEEGGLLGTLQLLHEVARPEFLQHAVAGCALGHEAPEGYHCEVGHHCARHGVVAHCGGDYRTHDAVEQECAKKRNDSFHVSLCFLKNDDDVLLIDAAPWDVSRSLARIRTQPCRGRYTPPGCCRGVRGVRPQAPR